MICHVIEVHCNGWLVQKFYAFHPNLLVLNYSFAIYHLADLVYAILLFSFVALREYDLLEAPGPL